jgi:hypothetical protein
MAKKKVSFVSVNFQQGPTELNAYYLPYSVGVLWSYASQFPEITEQWEFGIFEIIDGLNRLQECNWLKFGYVANNQITTLFNGPVSTFIPPDYGTLVLRWDPTGPQDSHNPLPVGFTGPGFTADPLTVVNIETGTNTNVYPVGAIYSTTIDETAYLEFDIGAPNETQFKTITYTKISYNGYTCTKSSIRSSLDSYASDIVQINVNPSVSIETLVFDVSNLPPVNEINFRIYFWNAASPDWMDLASTNIYGTGLSVYTK